MIAFLGWVLTALALVGVVFSLALIGAAAWWAIDSLDDRSDA